MSKKKTQTTQELWGQNTDKVWSEEDVQEFMNGFRQQQTLLEFLKE